MVFAELQRWVQTRGTRSPDELHLNFGLVSSVTRKLPFCSFFVFCFLSCVCVCTIMRYLAAQKVTFGGLSSLSEDSSAAVADQTTWKSLINRAVVIVVVVHANGFLFKRYPIPSAVKREEMRSINVSAAVLDRASIFSSISWKFTALPPV